MEKEQEQNKIPTDEKHLQCYEEKETFVHNISCDSRCRICNSDYSLEVRQLNKAGIDLTTISKKLLEKYNYQVSIASLSRHLKNYKNKLVEHSFDEALELFQKEKSNLAKHQAGILLFIDEAFSDVYKKYKQGYYSFDVSELKGLLELYYKILRDPDKANDEGDILALFQKFNSEAKITEQGVLFKRGSNFGGGDDEE